jgi:GT2 family glycosyltransferase/glycosyltransferase involved in cell wall biosynthesis
MDSSVRIGVVSVVLVNYKGTDDTIEAIRQLRSTDWPAELLEIVVVENASGDDSAARIVGADAGVVLVESSENLGFAGGCNLGVARSTGEFLAFLNNDAKPDAAWIRAAVARFASNARIGAIASRVLDWEGENVDYIGSAMTWFGMGYKPLTAQSVPKETDRPTDVLFGTGSAMFVRRSAYEQLDGFDERFFMFFEDVDFGWRLNLLGWRFVYEPASLAFHKHHASMNKLGAYKETYLLERNALFTLYKNLGDAALDDALPATLSLAVRRSVAKGGLDSTAFDIRKGDDDSEARIPISKETVAGLYAIDQFVENLDALVADRERVQSTRVVSDDRLWTLFGETNAPSFQNEHYLEGYDKIVSAFPVLDVPVLTRVLIITGDPVGEKMAGPAIRAWHMAETLSETHDVVLVSLAGVGNVSGPFDIRHVAPGNNRGMKSLEQWADVIVFQGLAMALFDAIRSSRKIIVADVYDPMHLEQLEQARQQPRAQWDRQVVDATDVLNDQLARADYLLCASERQRHFYLGQLAALGRVNPANYSADSDLRDLIDTVPFGLSSTPPEHVRQVLKGVVPGIGSTDKVVLWSGGLYNWFDPKTLVQAIAQVTRRRKNVRLFFQGTKHPHPGVPEMAIVTETRELAAELGVLDRAVFFNDSWVDYGDRQNYLTEADAGVSTHHTHVETTFSFRTRILDYLWAGLPIVLTEGDHFAELVEKEGLGVVVPSGDIGALANALEKVLFDEEFRTDVMGNIARVRESYRWEAVLDPLVRFMEDPRHAADLLANGSVKAAPARSGRPRRVKKHGFVHDAGLVVHYMRTGGPTVLLRKVRSRLGRR